ncbi:MAG: hypothetical protein AB7O68_07160 [Pirellulales bacterium]
MLLAIAAQVAVVTVEAQVLSSSWIWTSDATWYITVAVSDAACAAITSLALIKITRTRWPAPLLAGVAIGVAISLCWINYTSTAASFATTDLVSFALPLMAIGVANLYARGRVALWELLCLPMASIAMAAFCTIIYEIVLFTEWKEWTSTSAEIRFTSCVHWTLVTTGCCILMPRCLSVARHGRQRILSGVALVAMALAYPLFVAFGLTALARYSIVHDKPFGHWTADDLLTILDAPPSAALLLQALENDPWSVPLGAEFGNVLRDDWRRVYVTRLAESPDRSTFDELIDYFLAKPNPLLADCIAQVCSEDRGIEASPLLLRYSFRACLVPRDDVFEQALLRMRIPHGASPIIWLQPADGVPSDRLSSKQRSRLKEFLGQDAGDRRDAWFDLLEEPQWQRPDYCPIAVWQQLNAEMDAVRWLIEALGDLADVDTDARITLTIWRSIDWNAKSTDDFVQSLRATYQAAQRPELW